MSKVLKYKDIKTRLTVKIVIWCCCFAVALCFAAASLVFIVSAFYNGDNEFCNKVFCYGSANVVSGSMEPVLPIGTTVLYKTIESEDDYEIGDILIYYRIDEVEGEKYIVHRYCGKNEDGTLIFQGDANEIPDPYDITFDDVMFKVIFSIKPLRFKIPTFDSNLTVTITIPAKFIPSLLAAVGLIILLVAQLMFNRVRHVNSFAGSKESKQILKQLM